MNNIRYFKNLKDLKETISNETSKKFILVAENSDFSSDELKDLQIEYFGAIVTQVLFNEESYDKGYIVCDLNETQEEFLIKDMSNIEFNKNMFNKYNSFIVLVDGLSSYISDFLEDIFQVFPSGCQILGGGAGKLTLKQEPVIFSKEGIYENSALVLAMNAKLNVEVQNGWEFLEGPFLVTSCNKNNLKSLNFANAFEVYKEIVEKDSGKVFTKDNFFDLSKSYPFGIVKFNNEIVVRDPIALDENNNIILVGDISANSTVNILKGDKNTLLSASSEISKNVKNSTLENEIKNYLLFDCISRSIYLEDDFKKELKNINLYRNDKPLFGALTLGEIANNGNEYINFYNKTCVLGVIC